MARNPEEELPKEYSVKFKITEDKAHAGWDNALKSACPDHGGQYNAVELSKTADKELTGTAYVYSYIDEESSPTVHASYAQRDGAQTDHFGKFDARI